MLKSVRVCALIIVAMLGLSAWAQQADPQRKPRPDAADVIVGVYDGEVTASTKA
jgi:hypothetical protein